MKQNLTTLTKRLRTWAEVDLDRIEGNFDLLRRRLPENMKLLTVLKADAYGHGASVIASLLQKKADYFAVAFTDEAVALRRAGIKTPIMVLGHVPSSDHRILVQWSITAAIPAMEDALSLSRTAVRMGKTVKVHLVVDTGMSRIGFLPCESSLAEIKKISALPGLEIEGIFSHLASADESDLSFAEEQSRRFAAFVQALKKEGIAPPLRHLYNSAATVRMAPAFDMAREGILLYGLPPSPAIPPECRVGIKPAMALRSHIVHLKRLPAQVPVSYGCTYVTQKETVVATVCAGYADGVPRRLSPGTSLLLRGKKAPIIGRICMDQFMLDVTDIPGAAVGDTVTIFGEDGGLAITANELAEFCGSIGYELLCNINLRVPRVYLRGGQVQTVRRRLPEK